MVITLVAVHLVWGAMARADLRAAQSRAIAAGLPLEANAVIPPPCADEDNAALLYHKAFGLLTLGGKPYVPGKAGGSIDERLRELTLWVSAKAWIATDAASRAAALALLDGDEFGRVWHLIAEGAKRPRCRYDYDYSQGPGMLLPELSVIREVNRLGIVRARLLADAGRTQEAVDQLADLLWLRRQGMEDPILICQLAGTANEALVLGVLREFIAEERLVSVDVSRCRKALQGPERSAVYQRGIAGETVLLGGWVFRNLEGSKAGEAVTALSESASAGGAIWWLYGTWLGAPLRAGDEAAYLSAMTAAYQRVEGDTVQGADSSSWLHPVTRMLTPAYGMVFTKYREQEVLAATVAAELALASGERPETPPAPPAPKTATQP